MPIPNICPKCGSPVKEKSGISKNTGKSYSFHGCSNFPNCRWIYNANSMERIPTVPEAKDIPAAEGDKKAEALQKIKELYALVTNL